MKFLLLFLFLIPAVFAQSDIQAVSYTVAFIGGLLMFFAPCSYALVPAYFAVTFKQKTQLVKSTLIMFLGFISTFGFIAIATSFIGRLLNVFSLYLVKFSGVLFILFGIMALLSISFGGVKKQRHVKTPWQIFVFGALFALGFAACTGPVFYAILLLSTNIPTYSSIIFVMFYALGLFIPLFVMSYFFDKINFAKLSWINRPLFSIRKKDFALWNILSFLLFAGLGLMFLLGGNTSPIEYGFLQATDLEYRYTYGWLYDIQDYFLENGVSSLWILSALIIVASYIAYRKKEKIRKWFNQFS